VNKAMAMPDSQLVELEKSRPDANFKPLGCRLPSLDRSPHE
jgi:hypothetical protein